MSWERCPWCQLNLNGVYKTTKHYRQEHPTEYRSRRAEEACLNAKSRLSSQVMALERYDALAAELAGGLPPLAHGLIEMAMKKDVYRYRVDGTITDREVLVSYVTIAQGQDRTAQEYLARLLRENGADLGEIKDVR